MNQQALTLYYLPNRHMRIQSTANTYCRGKVGTEIIAQISEEKKAPDSSTSAVDFTVSHSLQKSLVSEFKGGLTSLVYIVLVFLHQGFFVVVVVVCLSQTNGLKYPAWHSFTGVSCWF